MSNKLTDYRPQIGTVAPIADDEPRQRLNAGGNKASRPPPVTRDALERQADSATPSTSMSAPRTGPLAHTPRAVSVKEKSSLKKQVGHIFSSSRPAMSHGPVNLDETTDIGFDNVSVLRAHPQPTKLSKVLTSDLATFTKPDGSGEKVSLAAVTPAMLASWEAQGSLYALMQKLSVGPKIPVYLASRPVDGANSELAVRSLIHQSVLQGGRHYVELTDGMSEPRPQRVAKRNCAFLLPATVLALKCLAQGDDAAFAAVCAGNAAAILPEIISLPADGGLLSRDALLAVFSRLAPDEGVALQMSSYLRNRSLAMGMLLNSYFRQFRGSDLAQKVSPALAKIGSFGQNDILLQNPGALLAEVSDLITRCMQIPDNGLVAHLEDTDVKKIGWQAATIIGSAFVYATGAAEKLRSADKKLRRKTAEKVEFLTTLASLAGNAGTAPAGTIEVGSLIAQKIGDFVSDRLAQPRGEFDLHAFAADLAYLSDSLRVRGRTGYLAPGLPENVFPSSPEILRVTEAPSKLHMVRGKIFADSFENYLSDYKVYQLQENLRQALH